MVHQEYFDILRENPLPFQRYVSRGDMPDEVDICEPRKDVEEAILEAIELVRIDNTPRIVPVLGEAGMGKTHLYWALKEKEKTHNFIAVYVPSPPNPLRTILHLYTCLMDVAGITLIENAANRLLETYGSTEKKSFLSVFGRRKKEFSVHQTYSGVASDIVKVLLIYATNFALRNTAERWLLSETLDEEDLEKLGVRSILDDDETCFAALKILLDNADKVVLFYFDEMETPLRIWGEEAERQILETMKKLYNELKNCCFIITSLPETWEQLTRIMDASLSSRMELPAYLKPFSINDIKKFYVEHMKLYWEQFNLALPDDPHFPLKEEEFEKIYEVTKGNPRGVIKQLRRKLKEKLKIEEEKREEKEEIKVTPIILVDSLCLAMSHVAETMGLTASLKIAYSYRVGEKQQQLAALMEISKNSNKAVVGFEIPNIKNWDKSGGVAAYYALKRLENAVVSNLMDKGVLVVPRGTSGEKYTRLLEKMKEKIILIEINQKEAKEIISEKNEISERATRIAERILEDIKKEFLQK